MFSTVSSSILRDRTREASSPQSSFHYLDEDAIAIQMTNNSGRDSGSSCSSTEYSVDGDGTEMKSPLSPDGVDTAKHATPNVGLEEAPSRPPLKSSNGTCDVSSPSQKRNKWKAAGQSCSRRVTRGFKRNLKEKKENQGLDALLFAMQEQDRRREINGSEDARGRGVGSVGGDIDGDVNGGRVTLTTTRQQPLEEKLKDEAVPEDQQQHLIASTFVTVPASFKGRKRPRHNATHSGIGTNKAVERLLKVTKVIVNGEAMTMTMTHDNNNGEPKEEREREMLSARLNETRQKKPKQKLSTLALSSTSAILITNKLPSVLSSSISICNPYHNVPNTPPAKNHSIKSTNTQPEIVSPSSSVPNTPQYSYHYSDQHTKTPPSFYIAANDNRDGLFPKSTSPEKSLLKDPQQQISLSLLDWRRRQQWTPANHRAEPPSPSPFQFLSSPDEFKKIPPSQTPQTATRADSFEYGLTSWEMINPNPDIPKHPTLLEIKRQRHRDSTYGTWCCQLLNCLNQSGRNTARYEFFYSDIDRAWFNHNQYMADLTKLGVPHNIRLSRTEWTLVRKAIRKKKPRRFSKAFLRNQTLQLEEYRSRVRLIQTPPPSSNLNLDLAAPTQNFAYPVFSPVQIGSTVTAYNKKARILHRGTVLARDSSRHAYLIQFERKELGCEFCQDTEVASHGVPEMLYRPRDTLAFDGSCLLESAKDMGSLPYGTAYGPLIDFHREQNMNAIVQAETWNVRNKSVARALHEELAETEPYFGDVARDEDTDRPIERHDSKFTMIETLAERETLVKLIGMLEAVTERKAKILQAISQFHDIFERQTPLQKTCLLSLLEGWNNNITPVTNQEEDPLSQSFLEHYAWLQANLVQTNTAMEASLVHLQVMYSQSYSGRPAVLKHKEEYSHQISRERELCDALVGHGPGGVGNEWLDVVREELDNAQKENREGLASRMEEKGEADENVAPLVNKLSAARNLILACQFSVDSCLAEQSQRNEHLQAVPASGSMGQILLSAFRKLQSAGIGLEEEEEEEGDFDIFLNNEEISTNATNMKNLEGSLRLLHAELTAATVEIVSQG